MAWPVAKFTSTPLLLWSASNRVVHSISARYFGYHYVWCSPVFDSSALGRYAVGSSQPPSSDPCSIYRKLHAAVAKQDEHDDAVIRQKTTLRGVALRLAMDGAITLDQAAEIETYINAAHISAWKPVIYVIPYANVAGRVREVPRKDRASAEPEFVIEDLKAHEFEIIEPMP